MVAPVWDGRERQNERVTTTPSVVNPSLQHPLSLSLMTAEVAEHFVRMA